MAGFYCIKNRTEGMTDEECVREIIVSGIKKAVSPLCRVCKVKARILKERPNLPRDVLSRMLGEKAASDLLKKKAGPEVKSAELRSHVRVTKHIAADSDLVNEPVKAKSNANVSAAPQAQADENISHINKPVKNINPIDKGGTKMPIKDAGEIPEKQCCTVCIKKGAKKWAVKDGLCTRCFRDKNGKSPYPKVKGQGSIKAGSIDSKRISPEYSEDTITGAVSGLTNLGHKKTLAVKAVEAVCVEPGKDIQTIITDAIKHLGNGHGPHKPPCSSRDENHVIRGKHKKKGNVRLLHSVPALGTDDKMVVRVDFSIYPHLLTTLKEISLKEYRDPAQQIIAMVADCSNLERKVAVLKGVSK